jgi:hypothetical protein
LPFNNTQTVASKTAKKAAPARYPVAAAMCAMRTGKGFFLSASRLFFSGFSHTCAHCEQRRKTAVAGL